MVAETPTRVFESTYPLYVDADSSVPVGLHRRPGRGSGGGRPAVEEVLAVDELPQRHARVLLVGEAGTGKTVALRRMAAQQQLHGEASVQPRFLRLDGSRSLTSLVEMLSERERSLLLVDGLERLDHRERREALAELQTLATGDPSLRYVVALRPGHVPRELPGQVYGLRPRTTAEIAARLRELAGDRLTRKVLEDSSELIFDLGRNPLYLVFLQEVLQSFGNLPGRRSKLLEALVDHRIDQAIARGLSRESTWHIREPLGQVAWRLVTARSGTHRVSGADLREAFAATLKAEGLEGDGAAELEAACRAGLLVQTPGDSFMFATSEFESWFASCELARQISYTGSPDFVPAALERVHDAVVLAAAQLEESGALIRHCLRLGQDLLVARCLRVSHEQESPEFEQAFLSRLTTGLEPRAPAEVRAASLGAIALTDTEASRRLILEQIRKILRRSSGAARSGSKGESAAAALRRLPGRLVPFVAPLRMAPPSTQRSLMAQLLHQGREREVLACAHLHRMLDLELDRQTVAVLAEHMERSEGNRLLHMTLEALGAGVVGRSLEHLLESRAFVRTPFPLGRVLRQGRSPEAEAALRDAFESPDERVRQVPVFVYVAEGDPAALGEIEACASSGHGHRRWFAAAALEGVTSPEAARILEELAEDHSERIRKQARASLRASRRSSQWENLLPRCEALGEEATPAQVGELLREVLTLGPGRFVSMALAAMPRTARELLREHLRQVMSSDEEQAAGMRDAMRILRSLPEAEQRQVMGDIGVARAILARRPKELQDRRASLLRLAAETVLGEQLPGQLPLGASHPAIERALDLLGELGWAANGKQDRDLPTAGEMLTGRLGGKVGAVCEVLRKRTLQGVTPPEAPQLLDQLLASLTRLGGQRELLRLVSDQRFGRGIEEPLRQALVRLLVVPKRGTYPEPLLSLAARRALEWFGRGRGPVRFPESDDEVRVDPWPYVWFRRFAHQSQRNQLGQLLARVIGTDQDEERRERNLRLLKRLDGGLLPGAHEAAGLPPPSREERRRTEPRPPAQREVKEAQAPAAVPAPTTAAAPTTEQAPPPAEPAKEEERVEPQDDGPVQPPVLQRPTRAKAVPPPPRPKLIDQVNAWWSARTLPQDTGSVTRRRARKGTNQKIRELIARVVANQVPARELEPGVLSALLALAPGPEDAAPLLETPALRARIETDLRSTPEQPWHRECLRRLDT